MGSTNKTTHYGLPQWIGTDKPTFLGDLNDAFKNIDTAIFNADNIATDVQSSITTLTEKVTAVENGVDTSNAAVRNLETNVNNNQIAITQLQQNVASNTQAVNALERIVDANQTANKWETFNATISPTLTLGNSTQDSVQVNTANSFGIIEWNPFLKLMNLYCRLEFASGQRFNTSGSSDGTISELMSFSDLPFDIKSERFIRGGLIYAYYDNTNQFTSLNQSFYLTPQGTNGFTVNPKSYSAHMSPNAQVRNLVISRLIVIN